MEWGVLALYKVNNYIYIWIMWELPSRLGKGEVNVRNTIYIIYDSHIPDIYLLWTWCAFRSWWCIASMFGIWVVRVSAKRSNGVADDLLPTWTECPYIYIYIKHEFKSHLVNGKRMFEKDMYGVRTGPVYVRSTIGTWRCYIYGVRWLCDASLIITCMYYLFVK